MRDSIFFRRVKFFAWDLTMMQFMYLFLVGVLFVAMTPKSLAQEEFDDLPLPPITNPDDPGSQPPGPPPPPPPPPPAIDEGADLDLPPLDNGLNDSHIPAESNPSQNGGTGNTATIKIKDKAGSEQLPPGQELVNIDFPEPTDIRDIIKAVSLWTGKNVLLGREVSGKIQIISPRKVTKEEAYQAFLSALNMLGFTTVETGKIIKILPVRTAVKGKLKTFQGAQWTPMTDEVITQIVPLKYIDAQNIQSTLSRIVSTNAIVAYPPTNTLIISDSGFNVRRVLDILELLDVQSQQPQVGIVPIRYNDAKGVADKIREIMQGNQNTRAYKIMVDEKSNSVIIFGPPRTISDVKTLVRTFDVESDDPSRQSSIHVRPLDYADAKKIASTLSALANAKKGRSSSSFSPPPAPGAGKTTPSAVADFDDNVKITADESSNSLLITGSRAAYKSINSIIRKLDMQKSQVFVEAEILDINIGNDFKAGTSIFAGAGSPNGSKMITTWEAANMLPLMSLAASTTGSTTPTAIAASQALAGFSSDLTVGVLSGTKIKLPGLGEISPGALIKLMKTDNNARSLASPHVLGSNNEQSKITVGSTIFLATNEYNPTSQTNVQKPQPEKVDLTVQFTPTISHSNYVTMKIDIEANSIGGQDPKSGLPIINRRNTSQIVTVKNNQTIVISGLVSTEELESFQKIPFLGDIPILGWLFRNSTLKKTQKMLVIFLSPHIVHGADDLAMIYKRKLDERDEVLKKIYGAGYKDDDFYASLPSYADGEYKPDPADDSEKQRRAQMLQELYDDRTETSLSGSSGSELDGEVKKRDEKEINSSTKTVPVPFSPPSTGSGGGSGGVSAPPPPPPIHDDGFDIPPPPADDLPPPPPPPPPPVD